MRAQGLGPITKWVDDHFFLRIRCEHLAEYNTLRVGWAKKIARNGGQRHNRGRLWFRGDTMDSGQFEEYDEDCLFPIVDQRPCVSSPRNQHDAQFTYSFSDIDSLSDKLGIPWEREKDTQFATLTTFIGLEWDIARRTVALPLPKRQKYLRAIEDWQSKSTHALDETQKLHGKLLHASLVLTDGRPYLTSLESFLGIFVDSPFKPRTPPKALHHDLQWWGQALAHPTVERPIPGPAVVRDTAAYSDASSGVGLAITIGNRWRAWRLVPGWKSDNRDIGWAEAAAFYFLTASLAAHHSDGGNFQVYGDNQGVVEGWWKGRSRNRPTNEVFKQIHQLARNTHCSFFTRYVPSGSNPADPPSRGKYYSFSLLLPAPPIPASFQPFIVDFDHPPLPHEQHLISTSSLPLPAPKPPRQLECNTDTTFDRQAEDLATQSKSW